MAKGGSSSGGGGGGVAYVARPCPTVATLFSECVGESATTPCVAYPLTTTTNGTSSSSDSSKCFNVKLTGGNSSKVEVVDSLPLTSVKEVNLTDNSIASISIDGSGATQKIIMVSLSLAHNKIESLANVKIPGSVSSLDLSSNQIKNLVFADGISNVYSLYVSNNPIVTVEGAQFSGQVETIEAKNLSITSVDKLRFPDTTKELDLSSNRVFNWSSFKPPQQLQTLYANNGSIESLWKIDFSASTSLSFMNFAFNQISSIEGVKFPDGLKHLYLFGSDISKFTIREHDVAVLAQLDVFSVASVKVSQCDPLATKTSVAFGKSAAKYDVCVLKDTDFNAIYFSTAKPDKDSPVMLALTIISIGVAVVAVLVVANILYRRRKMRQLEATRTTHNTSGGGSSTLDDASKLSLLDDIRNDPVLTKFRVDQKEVVRVRTIAKGGYGVVHLATYGRREIIMKQLLPDKAKDPRAISSFVAEIRLCSALEHPRIVSFLGLTWSTLVDLAILMEYMPNGDLAHLLKKQRDVRSGRSDFSWTHTSAGVGRNKLQLALDVAEGLVYLHGASIVHRDLKAQNVLLSSAWEAKLTDFGVSREIGDEMTAEVGTVSWIAPEILKGEDYGVQADVYSFGVVMSELDTCEKPYAAGIPESLPNGTKAVAEPSNARIALAVIEKRLQPAFHSDCPAAIRALAKKCLSYLPESRPSASQLHQELLAISRSPASASTIISSSVSSVDTAELSKSLGISRSAVL